MNPIEFQEHKESFLKLMEGKSIAEIRASRNTLRTLCEMTDNQRLDLIVGLELLEGRVTRGASEFERIMRASGL